MIDMNTTFEKSANTTDEWYTPKEIIDALGKFDLDPCAPVKPLWQTAETMYNKNHDGLTKDWVGRVWLNPPYSRPLIEQFVRKLAQHGNGIALLFNLYLRRQRQLNFYAEGFVFSGRTEYGGIRLVVVLF